MGITQPVILAGNLFSKYLISEADKNAITTITGVSLAEKATRLMNAFEATMKADSKPAHVLRELCDAIDNDPILENLAKSIREALG